MVVPTTTSTSTSTVPPTTTLAPATTTTLAPATTTTLGTTTTTTPTSGSSGVITAGDSRASCIFFNAPNGVLTSAGLSAVEATTGVTYNCIEVFSDADPAWSDWVNPWPTRTVSDGWDAWLAQSPLHQLVLGQQLIPDSVCTSVCADPLTWETQCASGAYNGYATQLAQNLVAEGAANTVIRLGKEFNGSWENDYIGTTTAEYTAWAQCFAQEVGAMRAVPGAHFLFDWNLNTCTTAIPLAQAYPGNAYVDIIGADFYDSDCGNPAMTAATEGWSNLYQAPEGANDSTSLANIAAFAAAHGKPLSLPEWGLDTSSGDDTAYVNGVSSVVHSGASVAYQSYFDCGCDGIAMLGSSVPNATAAYTAAFG